ncbi:MAG TPA: TolC family protein [Bryobacteraceae bacterium]|jgi:outer membrane protein TolC
MKKFQSQIAVVCVLLLGALCAAPRAAFAEEGTTAAGLEAPPASHWYTRLGQPYRWRNVAPVNGANSSRMDQLLRAGNLYLSLQDAVALTLENNIDIEIQRYGFDLAETDLFRAKATGNISGISTVPSSLTSSIGTANFLTSSTALPTADAAPSLILLNNAPVTLSTGLNGYDPLLQGTVLFGHQTTPEQNTTTTGTSSLVSSNKTANFALTQNFLTGASATLSYSNLNQDQNSIRNLVNPYTTSSVDLTVTQHLLQGRGLAMNNRPIRIAKNNLKVNDLVFEQQVINTVANVVQLYWILVSAIENVEVAQQAVKYSERLLDDNQKQVAVGTLAPVEVTRARAELAADNGALITAQTTVLQQEAILKTALSRNGVASPELSTAHVVPTDRIKIPDVEPVESMEELVSRAFAQRPEVKEARIQVESDKINIEGVRANLMPQVDAVADLRNNALSGFANSLPGTSGIGIPPSALVGGYSNALSQLFFRDFPNYSVGVTMTIPLRNRAAEANMATAQVNLRMMQQSVQRLENLIRLDVQNALIAVQQARNKHDVAAQQVTLEEELLDAENKKLSIGTSTPELVILVQRDLANAQLTEVQALTAYGLAKVQLDQSVGNVLASNRIEIDEAKTGRVSRPPSPIPSATAPK